jgi:hypothetical protein
MDGLDDLRALAGTLQISEDGDVGFGGAAPAGGKPASGGGGGDAARIAELEKEVADLKKSLSDSVSMENRLMAAEGRNKTLVKEIEELKAKVAAAGRFVDSFLLTLFFLLAIVGFFSVFEISMSGYLKKKIKKKKKKKKVVAKKKIIK